MIFPPLTVHENLETGFALLPRSDHRIPDEICDLFPILRDFLHSLMAGNSMNLRYS